MKPRLASIRIYPVKSLAPVVLNEVEIDEAGALRHDRAWALEDDEGRLVTGKRYPLIHTLRWLDVDDRERLAEDASRLLQRPLTLVEKTPGGWPDDTAAWGPTIASRATFAEVATWFAEEGMTEAGARMRFRANLEFDHVPAFWEDQLYPRFFRLGEVEMEGVNPCARCIVPTRDALTGDAIEAFQKRFMNQREATLPAWADRGFFNHFYRLTVNTRIRPDQAGKHLRAGDELEFR